MLSLQQIAKALGGEVSGRQVLCPGPGHTAADRSLSIRISDAGDDVVVHSFAGDDALTCKDLVRQKLGMPAWQPQKRGRGNGRTIDEEIDAVLAPKARPAAPAPQETASERRWVCDYDYKDLDGNLIYQVQRFEPKRFVQRRPNGKGGWIYVGVFHGISRVLYHLPELAVDLAAFPEAVVYVTEGEKDCGNIRALGLLATCAAGNVWTDEMVAVLKGRDVIILEHNDKAGREKSAKAAQALHGVAASVRIAGFEDLPEKGDVSDWIALDPEKHDAEALIARCRTAPLFDPTTVEATEAEKADEAEEPLRFIDISSWHIDSVPERAWGVRDLFPKRNVALLSGQGAAGKSLLALQLGVAHALGRDWIGRLPERGPFLYLGAEDDADEIYRRLADILKHNGADFADLKDNVHLLTLAGEDAVLGVAERSGLVKPTSLYARVMKAAIAIKPILIVLDTVADVAAINENDRSQVRQFIGLLRRLAIAVDAYVLVCSHPSLTGINTGTGLSGSTGWHNSVRSRCYLTIPGNDGDEGPDPDLRVLEFQKSNYGPISASIALRWEQGIWKPIGGVGTLEQQLADRKAEDVFLTLLERFTREGRHVTDKRSPSYAPTKFAGEPEAKAAKATSRVLEKAMQRLFAAGRIRVVTEGPPSRQRSRLVSGDWK